MSAMARSLWDQLSQGAIPPLPFMTYNMKNSACGSGVRAASSATTPSAPAVATVTKKQKNNGQLAAPAGGFGKGSEGAATMLRGNFDRAVVSLVLQLHFSPPGGGAPPAPASFGKLPKWMSPHPSRAVLPTPTPTATATTTISQSSPQSPPPSEPTDGSSQSLDTVNFVRYCHRCLDTVEKRSGGLPFPRLPDEQIARVYEMECCSTFDMFAAVWVLRSVAGPVAESVILVDRCVYMEEGGGDTRAYLLPIFDPLKSPRCCAVFCM
jgi:hypothetical protein